MLMSCCEFEGHDAAKRDAKQDRALQTVPIDKLRQVVDQLLETEGPAKSKAVVLTPQLIANDPEVLGEKLGERAKQLKAARHAGNQHQRRPLPPFAIISRVI